MLYLLILKQQSPRSSKRPESYFLLAGPKNKLIPALSSRFSVNSQSNRTNLQSSSSVETKVKKVPPRTVVNTLWPWQSAKPSEKSGNEDAYSQWVSFPRFFLLLSGFSFDQRAISFSRQENEPRVYAWLAAWYIGWLQLRLYVQTWRELSQVSSARCYLQPRQISRKRESAKISAKNAIKKRLGPWARRDCARWPSSHFRISPPKELLKLVAIRKYFKTMRDNFKAASVSCLALDPSGND